MPLMTILDPSIEETAVLALIVVLRILLSWSLSKEIEINTKKKEEVWLKPKMNLLLQQ